MKQINPILVRIMPYLMIAFAIIIFVLTLFVFSYVLIAAVVIGFIVFIVKWIRVKFFGYPKNTASPSAQESLVIIQTNITDPHSSEKTGRIIEHDDNEKQN